jgi:hypothetical protein
MDMKEFEEICRAHRITTAKALENKDVVGAIHQGDKWAVIDALEDCNFPRGCCDG